MGCGSSKEAVSPEGKKRPNITSKKKESGEEAADQAREALKAELKALPKSIDEIIETCELVLDLSHEVDEEGNMGQLEALKLPVLSEMDARIFTKVALQELTIKKNTISVVPAELGQVLYTSVCSLGFM